jgi:hypothetical protein
LRRQSFREQFEGRSGQAEGQMPDDPVYMRPDTAPPQTPQDLIDIKYQDADIIQSAIDQLMPIATRSNDAYLTLQHAVAQLSAAKALILIRAEMEQTHINQMEILKRGKTSTP